MGHIPGSRKVTEYTEKRGKTGKAVFFVCAKPRTEPQT